MKFLKEARPKTLFWTPSVFAYLVMIGNVFDFEIFTGDVIVSWVLIDEGSSSNVIFWSALRRMGVVEELI